MSDRSVPSTKQLVSSANKIDVRRVDTLHKSLIYSKNSDGPRIEPCGTPQETGKKPFWSYPTGLHLFFFGARIWLRMTFNYPVLWVRVKGHG